ncbi:hypothetical protein CRE_14490 [Caenorhabditis remanei]|uniref:Uncharacterized protein n=1 Tax=Caenorhabditis remanei TaxID=31234 RepID=E3M970_CAERE|nr:hypothetical protein CRE_14490 [Caenorhabditis remanei]
MPFVQREPHDKDQSLSSDLFIGASTNCDPRISHQVLALNDEVEKMQKQLRKNINDSISKKLFLDQDNMIHMTSPQMGSLGISIALISTQAEHCCYKN